MAEDVEMVDVHLLGVPLEARARFTQHTQELLRELALIQIGAERSSSSLPHRLLEVADELESTYGPFLEQPVAELEAATAAGRESMDVTYTVPSRGGAFARRLLSLLEEADDFCREQRLLTLPLSEELVPYRSWLLGEFIRQAAGAEARPWSPGTSAQEDPQR